MCLRRCVYHSTFLHLLPSMYDFMSDFIKKSNCALSLYMYISHAHTMHVIKFSTVLTAYDTI